MGSSDGVEGCEKSHSHRGSNPEHVSPTFIAWKSYYRPRFRNKTYKGRKREKRICDTLSSRRGDVSMLSGLI